MRISADSGSNDRRPQEGQYLSASDDLQANLATFISEGDDRNHGRKTPIIPPRLAGLKSMAAWQQINKSCVLGDKEPDYKSKGSGWYITGPYQRAARDPPEVNGGKGRQPRHMMWTNRAPLDPTDEFQRNALMKRLDHPYVREVCPPPRPPVTRVWVRVCECAAEF